MDGSDVGPSVDISTGSLGTVNTFSGVGFVIIIGTIISVGSIVSVSGSIASVLLFLSTDDIFSFPRVLIRVSHALLIIS